MSRQLEFPRPLRWDDDYWLCRCEGFRVDAPTGRLGRVREIRFRSCLDRPDELVVQSRVFADRVVVRVSAVAEVVPSEQRLVLRRAPERRVSGRLGRLRAYVAGLLNAR